MDGKKFLLAAIAYIVVTFVIAASWHLVLFKDLYDPRDFYSQRTDHPVGYYFYIHAGSGARLPLPALLQRHRPG